MTSVPDPTPDAVEDPQQRPALTPRELEILRLWLRSESKTVAASDLGISLGTINTHLIRIRSEVRCRRPPRCRQVRPIDPGAAGWAGVSH
jgi:DNA-binding CsgD family transcriptional regulator